MQSRTTCRSCGSDSLRDVLDLGQQPLANSLLRREDLDGPEDRFQLTLAFCEICGLVQIRETVPPERLFRDYLYFSSVSRGVLDNARGIAERMIRERNLGPESLVVEAASNDGYLLKNYQEWSVPVLGIDPAENIAKEANERGIRTLPLFFTEELAREVPECDVFHANNVLAHVADTPGFVRAIARVLKDDGVAVVEVPYLGRMIQDVEFDTIYHEHLCYFSLTALQRLFVWNGLAVMDVEQIPIHGGSLRVFARRYRPSLDPSQAVKDLLLKEESERMCEWDRYAGFEARVKDIGMRLWRLFYEVRGASIAAYGAAAKGSTLLNYFGIDRGVLDYVVDRSPHKQGLFLPGVHVPIYGPEVLDQDWVAPDYLLLLAWNFKDEIIAQCRPFAKRGGKFIVPIPEPVVL